VPGIRRVLTIAGSDSGGGAGIQADLKAFARCGVHGMTAITMVTAQNTLGVDRVHAVPPEIVVAQIRSVAVDIGIDAIKIGMLGDAETVAAVAGCLLQLPPGLPIVVDPVLVATSGAPLLAPDALGALVRLILPLATVLTPNLPEARALVHAGGADPAAGDLPDPLLDPVPGDPESPAGGEAIDPDDDDAPALVRALHRLGPAAVVVTGGHRPGGADLFFDGRELVEIPGPRHPGGATHGSGCTHSAALAAHLALGLPAVDAARAARTIAADAVGWGRPELGGGEGPVDVLARPFEIAPPPTGRLP
jgi:hydroxymethylpyrimidine/phosphomethylpyrimidine kinase